MSTIIATTLSNGSVSVPTATVVNGSAKAWVNFNGTGTIAIRDSFNVASITDNGTGDYTANFTTALTDADYVAVASARQQWMALRAHLSGLEARRCKHRWFIC
jgi:hypothetical protein